MKRTDRQVFGSSGGGSAAVAALAAAVLGASAARADPIDEILVTARKTAEPHASVPLAIDVLRDDGGEQGFDSLQSSSSRVPGLYFESAWGGLFSAPTLRGQQPSPTGDLNVGVFVDGVYQANPTAVDSAPIDVERIEVVRGPQSALFGHSTFAGAIHYVTRPPASSPEAGVVLEAGSGEYRGFGAHAAGPAVGELLGRVAFGARAFGGTNHNVAGDEPLGAVERRSLALQLATPPAARFRAAFAARLADTRSGQPPVASLSFRQYNCGAIEPASGAWSYYCGELPIAESFDISPGIPDSETNVAQGALTLEWTVPGGTLTSFTSYYRGDSDAYRDFDASSRGETFGVCTLGQSCGAGSSSQTVDRFVAVEQVFHEQAEVTEWSEELRYGWNVRRWRAMVGAALWRTASDTTGLFGASRGDLRPNERLTAVLPQSPALVGPQVLQNLALADDPRREQAVRSADFERRDSLALFGAADLALGERFGVRAELRTTRERRELDNRIASFGPGFGTAIPRQFFRDLTPRVSLQYLARGGWSGYVSAAKGSQAGGINPVPGLLDSEQTYEPEHNWTYEIGARYRRERVLALDLTAYHIDWRDAQLLGFPQTPGVGTLITLNTAGLRTRGLELALRAQPHEILRLELDLSAVAPEFRRGSDDPGSRRFCGLVGGNTVSTLCAIGPSRTGGNELVPYIDGNVAGRTPRRTWHAALELTPRFVRDERLSLRVDASGQDDVFERAINGASFGARSLVDARVAYAFGQWSLALWGRNLGDERYVRAVSSRGQVYYPTVPRPLDEIFGEGRRFGVTAALALR